MVKTLMGGALVLALSMACVTPPPPPPSYDVLLAGVDVDSDGAAVQGEVVSAREPMVYSDDAVTAELVVTRGQFGVMIENRHGRTLQIDWDGAAWVAPDGVTGRVVKEGTKVLLEQTAQTPTVIPNGARAQVAALPLDNYNPSTFPGGVAYWTDFVTPDRPASYWEGRELRLLLPVLAAGERWREYSFIFRLENVFVPALYEGSPLVAGGGGGGPVLLPGAPYRVPPAARFIAKTGGNVAYRLNNTCTSWHDIPEDQAVFYYGEEYVRNAGLSMSGEPGCN